MTSLPILWPASILLAALVGRKRRCLINILVNCSIEQVVWRLVRQKVCCSHYITHTVSGLLTECNHSWRFNGDHRVWWLILHAIGAASISSFVCIELGNGQNSYIKQIYLLLAFLFLGRIVSEPSRCAPIIEGLLSGVPSLHLYNDIFPL